MEPKEKAKELVDKFYEYTDAFCKDNDGAKNDAKQCALICVGEIIATIKSIDMSNESYRNKRKFWNDVKTEITKL